LFLKVKAVGLLVKAKLTGRLEGVHAFCCTLVDILKSKRLSVVKKKSKIKTGV
jgi:hypothetical protein